MKFIDKFTNRFVGLPSLFLFLLDKNFATLAREYGPALVDTDGFVFKEEDSIDSLQVDATGGNKVVYLPAQPVGNRRRRVTKIDASANTVTLNGNGNNINGAASYALTFQYDHIEVEALQDGTGWLIIDVL